MAVDHTPRRIACLQPSATVILQAVGELNRVVACTRYCADVVPGVGNGSRTILADSWTANSAQIRAVQPDLVIAAVPFQERALAEILKSGARFLGLAPKTLSDIYTDIATIAGCVGASPAGDILIRTMRKRVEHFRQRTADRPRPRVFCEEWGNPIIASQPWVAELVEAAGGEFLGAPSRRCTRDEIASLDPDIIIAAWCGAGDRVPLEKIIADRGWENTLANRSGRVFCIRDEYLNTPAPTLLLGLDALACAIHPEVFALSNGIRQITADPPSTAEKAVP
ncbi:MAG TPA: ABC transporter substrate-binding protein [Candidatus Sulfotelmatobacter sp.]|nr:ABC transporter substrate-binding protein [Candidatus Sulfotelmatobacter sp.]